MTKTVCAAGGGDPWSAAFSKMSHCWADLLCHPE